MRRVSRQVVCLAGLGLVAQATSAGEFTFAQAHARAKAEEANLAKDPRKAAWLQKELQPVWAKQIERSMEQCLPQLVMSAENNATLVVEVRSGRTPRKVYEGAQSPFSACMADAQRAFAWPKLPFRMRFIPMELKVNVNAGESVVKAAADVIGDIKPGRPPAETPK